MDAKGLQLNFPLAGIDMSMTCDGLRIVYVKVSFI